MQKRGPLPAFVLLTAAAILCCGVPARAALSILHEFTGGVGGARPIAPVTVVAGQVIYGVTSHGGAEDTGTIFGMALGVSVLQPLHSFDAVADPNGRGSFPNGPLTFTNNALYGVTEFGGADFDGVVYRINLNGSSKTPGYEFDMGTDLAVSPSGGVLAAGNDLFGTTLFGSATTEGTIYRIASDGTGFTRLHAFAGDGSEGEEIEGPLTLVGQRLWGVAALGGDADGGTIFRVNNDGTGFGVFHDFGDVLDDGATPVGGLLAHDGRLFGVARDGGTSGEGTLYAIDDDGTDYETVLDFSTGADGSTPTGRLTAVDDRLFGVTEAGGPSDRGTVYSIATDGTGYRLHHAFYGSDGASPQGGLTFDGNTLYGATAEGGNADAGVLFSLDPYAVNGDFNRDGFVDAADYTVWRDTSGSSSDLRADADFNGTVELADYQVWAANYGAVRQVPLAVTIPEPASVVVGMCGALLIATRRGHRSFWEL